MWESILSILNGVTIIILAFAVINTSQQVANLRIRVRDLENKMAEK